MARANSSSGSSPKRKAKSGAVKARPKARAKKAAAAVGKQARAGARSDARTSRRWAGFTIRQWVRAFLQLLVLAGVLALWVHNWLQPPVDTRLSLDDLRVLSRPLQPLLQVIGEAEGDYTAVNRGKAGDTPGDWPKANLGRSITEMHLGELRGHQGGQIRRCWHNGVRGEANLVAVGRYQFMPCTLHLALRSLEDLPLDLPFNEVTQDTLGAWLVLSKRKVLGHYLVGHHEDIEGAMQDLAREFASMPIARATASCKVGQSYYCNDSAGNAARASLDAVEVALRAAREAVYLDEAAQDALNAAEGVRGRLRRGERRWLQGETP